MNGIGDWAQRNWFPLASLLIQCAILVVVASYGSKMLSFVRAFFEYQRQIRQALSVSVPSQAGSGGGASSAWRDLISWLQAPIGSGGVSPFRKFIHWLQAPMGS